jgi:hypothetical protein
LDNEDDFLLRNNDARNELAENVSNIMNRVVRSTFCLCVTVEKVCCFRFTNLLVVSGYCRRDDDDDDSDDSDDDDDNALRLLLLG